MASVKENVLRSLRIVGSGAVPEILKDLNNFGEPANAQEVTEALYALIKDGDVAEHPRYRGLVFVLTV